MSALVVTTVVLVGLLVAAERSDTAWRLPVKAIASAGFIAIAIDAGALDTGYGRWVLMALLLAWIGDVLLALPGRRAFLGGLVAFLLGHLAYVVAFAVRGVGPAVVAAVAAGATLIAIGVWRWLRPHLDARMIGPVSAYIVVISLMVAMAAGTTVGRIVVGAVAFFLSDLFVARERFVTPGFTNRAWGLPLYYGAQVLLALSVAS